jgi:hypothetical protein
MPSPKAQTHPQPLRQKGPFAVSNSLESDGPAGKTARRPSTEGASSADMGAANLSGIEDRGVSSQQHSMRLTPFLFLETNATPSPKGLK